MLRRALHWVLVGVFGFFLASPVAAQEEVQTPPPAQGTAPPGLSEDQYFEMMRILADAFEQVDQNYVKEVDRRKLVEAAIRGMMRELDPFSNYINPDDLTGFRDEVEKEFGGIGIQVGFVTQPGGQRKMIVSAPLPGTPAAKAGIRPGDAILQINGKAIEQLDDMNAAMKEMRGAPGSEVKVTIQHASNSEVETLTIERAIIEVPTVYGMARNADGTWNYMLDDERKIGYVRLTGFSRHSAREMLDTLKDLQTKGMKGLVFDLRANPGGLLNIAIEIADMFIEEGKIVSTKGRNTIERPAMARKEGTFPMFPVAILVDRFSASASEVVSAALQDHDRAVIVGERTFGKGSVQNVIDMEGGKSALKLTTASYHRPNGKNIHRFPDSKEEDDWGVRPNGGYEVKFNNEDLNKLWLFWRQSEDYRVEGSKDPKPEYNDRQLAKALEYIYSKTGATPPAAPASPATEQK